jgi:enediyne biosynthesis protein E4
MLATERGGTRGSIGRMRARPMSRGVIAMVVVAIAAAGGLAFATAGDREASRPVAPHFVDDTAASGVDHRYEGGFPFFVGGGVAAFDCDDDGLPDLYLAGGSDPAALYHNESAAAGPLRFSPLASVTTDLTDVTGAYPIDIDGDSHIDLAILRVGEDVVLRGKADCEFERANERWGIDGGDTWTDAFSATWEGTNTLPTLAFGDYLAPDHETCEDSRLLRPGTGGYAAPVALTPGYCTLSILFSDWQRSGRRDLRMSNDRHYYRDGTDQLWRIEPDAPPVVYGEGDGWRPLQIWGMGIASQDVTGDGRPEVFLTSQGDNKLQSLVGDGGRPTYEDIALERGVTATRPFAGGDVLPSTAWHAEFQDVNNDGFVDLFVTKGNVEAQPDYATRDPNNLLLGTADGTFVEGADAAGIVDYRRGRGAAVIDLNLDGMLDLVVVNRRENVTLWRNAGRGDADRPLGMGRWIEVRPRQPSAPNLDAIGSWIEVRIGDRVISREVTIGGGHAGGQLGWLHVGIGDEADAEVRVRWPDGAVGPWQEVAAGERRTIDR